MFYVHIICGNLSFYKSEREDKMFFCKVAVCEGNTEAALT